MTFDNDKICPEDTLKILLPVEMIPDGSTVTKRTGEQEFTLRRSLRFWTYPPEKRHPAKSARAAAEEAKAMSVQGLFIVSSRGDITQVKPGTILCLVIHAETFVELMRASWYGDV